MDSGGSWLAALGPYDSQMQRLVFFDVQSGRRLFDRPVARSATFSAITGSRGVWLSDARQIVLSPRLESRALFDHACSRRPEGRKVLDRPDAGRPRRETAGFRSVPQQLRAEPSDR